MISSCLGIIELFLRLLFLFCFCYFYKYNFYHKKSIDGKEIKSETKEHKPENKPEVKPEHKNGHKKFLFVSNESLSGDLAWQIQKEGHKVRCYIKSGTDQDVYNGILEKVSNWREEVDWADVIVFDDTGFGEIADKLRKEGKFVVGGTAYTDRLGVNVLPRWNFTNMDEAIDFLQKTPGRYVLKPSGFIGSDQKALLFIAEEEDGKDLLEVMMHNRKAWSKKAKHFQLQKYVTGVEVAVGAFFNGKDFITPVCVNFEHKRMFPGDIGPFTGEMGTLMFFAPSCEIYKQTLEKMKPLLAESNYVGYVDINCIADRDRKS